MSSGTNVAQACDYKAVEHALSGEVGAIMQVIVRNEDCSYAAGQVLASFDIRGPPSFDLMAQSTGLNVEVEAVVTSDRAVIGFGYLGRDGTVIPLRTLALGAPPTADGSVARSVHTGDNRVSADQDSLATTGDAVSGSQRLHVVVEGDARALRVMAQNAAPGASAASGDAVAGNAVEGRAGPEASGEGAEAAQAGQTGSNDLAVAQDARARSGDALSGVQEIGVRVTGSVGELAVLAQNASPAALAISGDAFAANDAVVAAGPEARAAEAAQAGQVGDNRLRVDQSSSAQSGDAVAGSQVIGVWVGGSAGSLAVVAANDAEGAVATSGDAVAGNAAEVTAGPIAVSGGEATSAQVGSNDVRIGQSARAVSGRALAGAQVIQVHVVGGAVRSALLPSNVSTAAQAQSGDAQAANDAAGSVGPVAEAPGAALTQQAGQNTVEASQDLVSRTGDAVAGGQVVGGAAAPSGVFPDIVPALTAILGRVA